MSTKYSQIASSIIEENNNASIFNTASLYSIGKTYGMTCREVKENFVTDALRVGRGQYNLALISNAEAAAAITKGPVTPSETEETTPLPVQAVAQPTVKSHLVAQRQKTFEDLDEVYIPSVDPNYVAWGEYSMIKKIIDSREFFPTFISGLSGNGKTMMVKQACAKAKREYVRVQISPETDENDLIGGFRLVDGETVFYRGPVLKAMERGCILLIDELDRGSNKLMCLQGILEGEPVLVKKLGQVIKPAPGFNIIATANTKGRGSEDGRFVAANIIDEAFIERFAATVDQPYPNASTEKNIIVRLMKHLNVLDEEFADKLVAWSEIIRKTYDLDGVTELVSTRRLCHIVKAFSIFKDRHKSISMCISRFDNDTRSAFDDLYTKIDGEATEIPEFVSSMNDNDDHPF